MNCNAILSFVMKLLGGGGGLILASVATTTRNLFLLKNSLGFVYHLYLNTDMQSRSAFSSNFIVFVEGFEISVSETVGQLLVREYWNVC